MLRRWKAFIFLTTLLVTTLGFASFASAHTDKVTVVELTAEVVENNAVDVAPEGLSLGDSFAASENLFKNGRQVGFSGVTCTFVRLEHPRPPSSA